MPASLDEIRPFGILATALTFGGAAVLLWVATGPALAFFVSVTGVEPIIGWFVLGGLLLATLVLAGCLSLRAEGEQLVLVVGSATDPLDRSNWLWTIGGIRKSACRPVS